MDKTNLLLITTDNVCNFEELFGSEQDRLDTYNECMNVNNCELETEYNQEVEDYFSELAESYFEDFLSDWGSMRVLAIAELGLWNGPHDGGRHGQLSALLGDACEDCNTLYYDKERKAFVLEAIHHDGTNWFTFYGLTQKGREYLDKHGDSRETHQHVLNTAGYIASLKY